MHARLNQVKEEAATAGERADELSREVQEAQRSVDEVQSNVDALLVAIAQCGSRTCTQVVLLLISES